MKKTLTIALILTLLVGGLFILTGCGNEQENNEELISSAVKYEGLYTNFVGDPETE